MDKVFLSVLNMSLTGAFVIAAVCLARLPLQKAPKIISYCLWIVVAFRLVCPFSIESAVSLVPFNTETIPPALVAEHINRIDSGIVRIDEPINGFIGQMHEKNMGDTNGNWWASYPLRELVNLGVYLWLIGAIAMVMYGLVSYLILKSKMRGMAHLESNIYESEIIESPFVLGVLNPKIYLPVGLSEKERGYVVLHEQTHIKRRDHVVKFAAYFILCLHWFNPLVWVAFLLMGVDMEMSCDERVLREMGGETKKDYSLSLLSLATQRRFVGGSPLAFGEGGVKERIKRVLNFKKPSRVIIIAAIALAAVLIAGCAVNRANKEPLIEFEVVYSDVNEYSFSEQFKLGDIMYSPYFTDDFLGGTRGLKEIGFAVGDFSGTVREGQRNKYRIFEREGYSIDEYIIVKDDGLMNPATIFVAVQPDAPESPVAEQEISYEPWMSSWRPLSDLHADYSLDEARTSNTIVVIGDDGGIYNQHMVDIFYREAASGGMVLMRVVYSTHEGNVLITDIQYDGEVFTVTHDSTRDKVADSSDRVISTRTYKYLAMYNRTQPASVPGASPQPEPLPGTTSNAPAVFYLSNEENIHTTTPDGRIMLIEDLWWIPPPSDTAVN